jgi:hypothetical protein
MKAILLTVVLLQSANAFSQAGNDEKIREQLTEAFKNCKMTEPVADIMASKLMESSQANSLRKLKLDQQKLNSEMGQHCDFAMALKKSEIKSEVKKIEYRIVDKQVEKEVVNYTVGCKYGKENFEIPATVQANGDVYASAQLGPVAIQFAFNEKKSSSGKEFVISNGSFTFRKSLDGHGEIGYGTNFIERRISKMEAPLTCSTYNLKRKVTKEIVTVQTKVEVEVAPQNLEQNDSARVPELEKENIQQPPPDPTENQTVEK